MLRRTDPRDDASTRPSLRPHVLFAVGGVPFAFDAVYARHVLGAAEAAAGGAVYFLGRPYPVLDLRRVFGHAAPASAGFVILVEADVAAALLVDELRGLCSIAPGRLAPLPAVYRGEERRWIAGLATTADDAVIVVALIPRLLRTLLAGVPVES